MKKGISLYFKGLRLILNYINKLIKNIYFFLSYIIVDKDRFEILKENLGLVAIKGIINIKNFIMIKIADFYFKQFRIKLNFYFFNCIMYLFFFFRISSFFIDILL